MPDLFQQESPLVQVELGEPVGNAPRIEEKPFLGYINLRGRSDDTRFLAGVLKVLGCEPPTKANTVVASKETRIYWLGPDEWLIVTPAGMQGQLKADLLSAFGDAFCSVVDNSSGLTMLHITGENAAALLATDCPLDLHPREFKPGQCAQTRLAKAGMTLSPLADNSGFEVIIRRSFADYLLLWLQDAAIAFE
ncbi:MAG: sarcosine oxidase subunit gamma [Gammaproteobacteria bacterium]|nr:sarcosine oxidase subunit gamma [Gammaproteobacteria bacterium]MDH3856902.1 sarcosine oxidase subunit gamma [Gammaproteobacteria bacterium]